MRYSCIVAAIAMSAALAHAEDAKTVGVAPEESKEGFVSLFDGQNLKGWQAT